MEKPELSAREQRKLKRKQSRKPVVLPIRKLDPAIQLKAELKTENDKEVPKAHKFALQQKYGLASVSETDIEWYLTEVATRG